MLKHNFLTFLAHSQGICLTDNDTVSCIVVCVLFARGKSCCMLNWVVIQWYCLVERQLFVHTNLAHELSFIFLLTHYKTHPLWNLCLKLCHIYVPDWRNINMTIISRQRFRSGGVKFSVGRSSASHNIVLVWHVVLTLSNLGFCTKQWTYGPTLCLSLDTHIHSYFLYSKVDESIKLKGMWVSNDMHDVGP